MVGRRDEPGTFYVQVKTADRLTGKGLVQAHAKFARDLPPLEDPAFVYAVILLSGIGIGRLWVVPSAEFNRLAYRATTPTGELELHFRARPEGGDAWAPHLVDPHDLAARLAAIVPDGPPRLAPPGALRIRRSRAQ